MTILGYGLILGVFLAYLGMLFVAHRFTYKTWVFDAVVGAGMALGAAGWVQAGGDWLALGPIGLGALWFLVSRTELKIAGSPELRLRVGDAVPALSLLKTDGSPFTEQDLIAGAPALLTLYRGWWCPSSRAQLDLIRAHYESFASRGVAIYAASVDEPAAALPIQEHVGSTITILCGVSEAVLTKAGVLDQKGAPWDDRLILGAPERPIAMPATLVFNRKGILTFVSRSARVDDPPRVAEILASLTQLS